MRLWPGIGVAVVAAVTATGAFGGSGSETIATARTAVATPTLAVVVVGSGRVTSTPSGISCPGKCAAAFAAGSRVLLTPTPRSGSRFLRWGGDCTGARACRVRVSGLAAVAAQFVGSATKPTPTPASAVVPGGYSGQNSQNGNGVTLSVPTGGGRVLNFSIPRANLVCVGGGGFERSHLVLEDRRQGRPLVHRDGLTGRRRQRRQGTVHLLGQRALRREVRDRSGRRGRCVSRRPRVRGRNAQVHDEQPDLDGGAKLGAVHRTHRAGHVLGPELAERQRRHALRPRRRRQGAELLDPESQPRLPRRRRDRRSDPDRAGDDQARPLVHRNGVAGRRVERAPERSSRTSCRGPSRDTTVPERRSRPGCTARTSCTPTARVRAPRTTRPGQPLGLDRGRATTRKGR